MSFLTDAELLSMRDFYGQSMVSQITVERWTGQVDDADKKTYGPPEQIVAHVKENNQQVYNQAGELTVAVAQAMVPYDSGITTEDQVTLPGATKPAILLSVGPFPSDSWPLTEKLLLGRA